MTVIAKPAAKPNLALVCFDEDGPLEDLEFDTDDSIMEFMTVTKTSPDQVQQWKSAPDVEATFTKLICVGDLLGLAKASAGSHSCSENIIELNVDYRKLVGDSEVIATSFADSCRGALGDIKMAYLLSQVGKWDLVKKNLSLCAVRAGKMQGECGTLVALAEKMFEDAKRAVGKTQGDSNTAKKDKELLAKILADAEAEKENNELVSEERQGALMKYEADMRAIQAEIETANELYMQENINIENLTLECAEWMEETLAEHNEKMRIARETDRQQFQNAKTEVEQKRADRIKDSAEKHAGVLEAWKKEQEAKFKTHQAEVTQWQNSKDSKADAKDKAVNAHTKLDNAKAHNLSIISKTDQDIKDKNTEIQDKKKEIKTKQGDIDALQDASEAAESGGPGLLQVVGSVATFDLKGLGSAIQEAAKTPPGSASRKSRIADLEAEKKELQNELDDLKTEVADLKKARKTAADDLLTVEGKMRDAEDAKTKAEQACNAQAEAPVYVEAEAPKDAVDFSDLPLPEEKFDHATDLQQERDRQIETKKSSIQARKDNAVKKLEGLQTRQKDAKELYEARQKEMRTFRDEAEAATKDLIFATKRLDTHQAKDNSLGEAIEALGIALKVLCRLCNIYATVKEFWKRVAAHCEDLKTEMSDEKISSIVELAEMKKKQFYNKLNQFMVSWGVLAYMNVRASLTLGSAKEVAANFLDDIPVSGKECQEYKARVTKELQKVFGDNFLKEQEQMSAVEDDVKEICGIEDVKTEGEDHTDVPK